MNENQNYEIRKMSSGEVKDIAVEWAAREGWNPGLYDAPCFYAADNGGFYVGLLGGEPISCISNVKYRGDFAFIGFYIVKPEYRGKGYGYKIWQTAIEDSRGVNTGLDGVIEQQDNYKKSGFKLAYSNIRWEGSARRAEGNFSCIIPASEADFAELCEYDSRHFPAPREDFLKCWLNQPESFAVAAVNNSSIIGLGMLRKCRVGYKIGPLFANGIELAEKIFLRMNNFVPNGENIYFDTPEVNKAAVAIAEKYSMEKVFGTARMYSKYEPTININEVFGVTTFELG